MANLDNTINFTLSSEIVNNAANPHWARLTVKQGETVVFGPSDIGIELLPFVVSLPQDEAFTLRKAVVAEGNVETSMVEVPYRSNFERAVVTG
jgi:hypothetical protein